MKQFGCLLLMVVAVVFGWATDVSAQTSRVLTKQAHQSTPHPTPIHSCGLTYNNKTIQFNQPFAEANDLWFNNLKFCVTNTSGQTIKAIRLELWLQNSNAPKNYFGVPYLYVGTLVPNGTALVGIEEPIESVSSKFNYSNLTFRIESVVFDNDIMWFNGEHYQYDAGSDSWTPIATASKPEHKLQPDRKAPSSTRLSVRTVAYRVPASQYIEDCGYILHSHRKQSCIGITAGGQTKTCKHRTDTMIEQPLCFDPFYTDRNKCGSAATTTYFCGRTPCSVDTFVPCNTSSNDF